MILATVYKGLSNKPRVVELPAGKTLAQCFPEEDLERAAIFANSRAEDGDYVLKEGDSILIRMMPGAVTTAIVTAIVAVAAIAITSIVVGTQIYKQKKELAALQEQLESMQSASGSNIDNRPFLRGASNTAATSKTQPYICGRHLFTPYLLSDTFYEITGTDGATQYANTMLEGGFCPQVIHTVGTDDINILELSDAGPQEGVYSCNESSVFASGTVEIRQSGALMESNSELNYKHVVTTANEEVPRTSDISSGDAEDYVFTLDSHAMDVEVCISFTSGLYAYNSDGDMVSTSVTITPQYSLDGGSSWKDFTFYNSYTGTNTNTFSRSTSTKELRYTAKKTFSLSDYQTLYDNGESAIYCRVRSSGANDSQIRNSCYVLYYQSKCFDPNTSSSPAGALDDGGEAGLVPCCVLNERERKKSTMIGVRLESTSSNEDKLSKIFVISSGVARTWDGAKWSSEKSATRNPAAWALEILTSDTHALSKFGDDEIDLESFGDFYEFCEENEFCFDYVISSKTKKETVLGYITDTCGAALYTDIYGRQAIAIDRAQENAVAIYNPQNIISIENEREFARRTDCVRVTYTNSEDDLYEEDTCSIMREVDGAALDLDEDTVITDVTANGITTYGHAAKYARRCMAIEILRPKKTTIEVGNEGIFLTPYAKILLQDDSLKIGTGSAVVKGVNWQDGIARTLVLKNPVTVEEGKSYGAIVECFTETGTARLSLKVSADPGDCVEELSIETLLRSTDSVVPEGGEVLSFGELDDGGDFTKITTPYVIAGISRTESGFSLELANYDEAIYDSGSIPEYRSNITQRPVSSSAEIPSEAVSLDDVYQAAKSSAQSLISGSASVGDPDAPSNVEATAEQDGISLSCSLGSLGLRNDISSVTWEVEKAGGSVSTAYSSGSSGYYTFDRSVDGYPEAEELYSWRARCKAENHYGGESEWSDWAAVSAASYGTWAVSAPSLTATVSGRAITLTILQPSVASGRTRYGTFLNRVWIQKPSEGEEWYKPATTLDPYASEDNWQEGEGYTIAETVYTQTMPLTGQTLVDTEVDGEIVQQSSPEDTLYRFRVQAYSEAGEGDYSEINATALGTGIQDLVQGSVTHDKISTPSLSAINANMGYITSGAFQGSALNYWALSTIQGMQSSGIDDVWEGAFRVGGEDEYLLVEPQVTNSVITGYRMYFRAGVFEITADASTLNGELTVQASTDALDRTRITPTGTYWEHRETVDGDWVEKARVSQSGIRASNLISEQSLIVTNMDLAERRALGHDIGRAHLSDAARVWHFDTDFLDHEEREGLAIEGDAKLDSSIEPAILAVSPYAEDAAVAAGQFSASITVSDTGLLTVDFWIQYVWNENQVLFEAGDGTYSLSLVCANAEPYFNEYSGAADGAPWNEETQESGGVTVWNEPAEAAATLRHGGGGTAEERVSLDDLGVSLVAGEWLHCAIIANGEWVRAYLGKARSDFARLALSGRDITVELNPSRGSFILDELYVDTGAEESFGEFCANTDARIPWGTLDPDTAHFVLDAKNLVTNIFGSDAFGDAFASSFSGAFPSAFSGAFGDAFSEEHRESQKPATVYISSSVSVQEHSTFVLGASGITLTLGDGAFAGCTARVINASSGAASVKGTGFEGALWAGTEALLVWRGGEWLFEAGDGYLSNGAWRAWTAAGLLAWASYMASEGDWSVSCALQASVDLTGKSWTPVGTSSDPYTGSFSGGGHSISGLSAGSTSGYQGFFGYIGSGGEARDLHLDSTCYVVGASYVGGIAGYSAGAISNCSNDGLVWAISGNYAGGIAGYASGGILNCRNSGLVMGSSDTGSDLKYTGGVCGYSTGVIASCLNTGAARSTGYNSYVGGIAGQQTGGLVVSCMNTGAVTGGTRARVGGIAGEHANTGYCHACANSGTVSATSYWASSSSTTTSQSSGACGGIAGILGTSSSITCELSAGSPSTTYGKSYSA